MNDSPASERGASGLRGTLDKLGMGNVNVNDSLGKVRDYARSNPGLVLGGLAALAIGAGLMRRR